MKNVKTILTSVVFIMLLSVTAFAGNGPKVIAVVNEASWCPTCQNNGERAMGAFMENNKDMAIQFVTNDLTNDETKAKSAVELKKLGLDKAIEPYNGTGVAYFFNSETKKLTFLII